MRTPSSCRRECAWSSGRIRRARVAKSHVLGRVQWQLRSEDLQVNGGHPGVGEDELHKPLDAGVPERPVATPLMKVAGQVEADADLAFAAHEEMFAFALRALDGLQRVQIRPLLRRALRERVHIVECIERRLDGLATLVH